MTDIDRDLRALFARLKEEDRARAPAFRVARTVAPPAGNRPLRAAFAVAAAAAAVVVALTVAQHRQPRIELSTWTSPTDFLLNTPGSELLRTVPTFGVSSWTHQRNRS